MATLPIFPSLSRAPSMDSSEQVEDDTIRDQMELGYVATRPRFTRARRTWNINTRNLTAEDARALRYFRDHIALRGALSFRYPNLLANGSFEVPSADGSPELVAGWVAPGIEAGVAVSAAGAGFDGVRCIQFSAAGRSAGALTATATPACSPGDIFQFSVYTRLVSGAATGTATLVVQYDDGSTSTATCSFPLTALGAAWALVGGTLAVPPGTGTGGVGAFSFGVQTLSAGVAVFDCAGLARAVNGVRALEMAGSGPITVPVRFPSGGTPQMSDLGWVGGGKRYGATFKLEEL